MYEKEQMLLDLIAASEEPTLKSIADKLDKADVNTDLFLHAFNISVSETIELM